MPLATRFPNTWDDLLALPSKSPMMATPPGVLVLNLAPPLAGPQPTGWKKLCCAPPPWKTTTSGLPANCPSASPEVKNAAETLSRSLVQ